MASRVLYLFTAAGLAAIAYGGRELVTAEPLNPEIWPWVFAVATAACLVAAVNPARPASWLVAWVAVVGLAVARCGAVMVNMADGHVYATPKMAWLSLGVWVLIATMAVGSAFFTRPPRSWDG